MAKSKKKLAKKNNDNVNNFQELNFDDYQINDLDLGFTMSSDTNKNDSNFYTPTSENDINNNYNQDIYIDSNLGAVNINKSVKNPALDEIVVDDEQSYNDQNIVINDEVNGYNNEVKETKNPVSNEIVVDDEQSDNAQNLGINDEVNKFKSELEETKKQLQKYLSKFSEEKLNSIRQTDYYKERLAYWRDYYSKRLKQAEQKDNENNLARNQALSEIKQNIGDKHADKIVISDKDKKEINNISKTDWCISKIDNVLESLNTNKSFTDITFANNQTIANQVSANKQENNIDKEVKIDDKQANEEKKPNIVSLENKATENSHEKIKKSLDQESVNKISKYLNAVLLDSLHESLKGERDALRKVVAKLSTEENKASKYISNILDNNYAIYSDAVASFDNVVNKNGLENKKEAEKRQKDAQSFSKNPQLKIANNMLVDNIRNTLIDNVSKYLTKQIVSEIESQGLQDDVLITKSSIKDVTNQIMAGSKSSFEKFVNNFEKFELKKIENLQQSYDNTKFLIGNDKNLSKEEKITLKTQLAEKQNSLKYEKFYLKYNNSKYNKQLKKPSANFLMNIVLEDEIAKISNLKSQDKLQEYFVGAEEMENISDRIIKILNKNGDLHLNFKLKENSNEKLVENQEIKKVDKKDEEEILIIPEVEEIPLKVEEEIPLKVEDDTSIDDIRFGDIQTEKFLTSADREDFIDERSIALYGVLNFAQKGKDYFEKVNNQSMRKYFNKTLTCVQAELSFWELQVQSMKDKIELLKSKNEYIPKQYYDLYLENFNCPIIPYYDHNGINQSVLKKLKELNKIDDENKYIENLSLVENIASSWSFVENIEDSDFRDLITDLNKLVTEYDGYIFCDNLTNKWKKAINAQIEQKPCEELPVVMPENEFDNESLKGIIERLDKNEDYYKQILQQNSNIIKEKLDVLELNKDKLVKYNKAVNKFKQIEEENSRKKLEEEQFM